MARWRGGLGVWNCTTGGMVVAPSVPPTAEDFPFGDDFGATELVVDLTAPDIDYPNGFIHAAVGETLDLATVDVDADTPGRQTSIDLTVDSPTPGTPFGTVSVNDSGILTFTHELFVGGVATVRYTVRDTDGRLSNIGTITITMVEV